MQWKTIFYVASAVLIISSSTIVPRAPFLIKRESRVINTSITEHAQNTLHIHNDRGSIKAASGNVRKPHIEAHILGPEGYTEYIELSTTAKEKEAYTTAKLTQMPTTNEKGKKQKRLPTLDDFTIDYYVTLPSHAGITASSDGTLHVTAERVNGDIGINGNNITCNISNAGSAVSIDVYKGDIQVTTAHGYVNTVTRSGSVTVSDIHADVNADAHGPVSVTKVQGNAFLRNHRSTMELSDISGILTAHTRDSMYVTQHEIGSATSMFLEARNSVYLYLPRSANASFRATTMKGMITSEIPITMDPITTPLSKEIWRSLQKRVKGKFRYGGATITVDAYGYVHVYQLQS